MCGCGGGSGGSGGGTGSYRGGLQYAVIANGYRVAYSTYEQALRHKQAMAKRGQTDAQIKKVIPGARTKRPASAQ